MTTITLFRIDPTKNMRRFYRLDMQRDLFGSWCVMREWGRVGRGGQMRTVPYADETEAQTALAQHRRRKERRGYRPA